MTILLYIVIIFKVLIIAEGVLQNHDDHHIRLERARTAQMI